jgi:hypothetical protein
MILPLDSRTLADVVAWCTSSHIPDASAEYPPSLTETGLPNSPRTVASRGTRGLRAVPTPLTLVRSPTRSPRIAQPVLELEADTFAPEHRRVRRAELTPEAVGDAVREAALAPAAYVLVSDLAARAAGDFIVWLAGDRARVRLDLHREWYATRPGATPGSVETLVPFRDSDGSEFHERLADTVSRDQAVEAFFHWLRTGEMDPALAWK